MAKYDYERLTDPANMKPKHLPNVANAIAAETALQVLRVSFTSKQNVDDAVEFIKSGDVVGIYGITPKMLFYNHGGGKVEYNH